MEAQTHHRAVRLGRRGRGPAGLHRMGRRRTPRSCAARPPSISTPTNGRGYLQVEGSHTLEKFINGVARDVDDPETEAAGLEAHATQAHRETPRSRPRPTAAGSAAAPPDLRIGALGSGSDYTVFLDHLGDRLAEPGLRRRRRRRHLPLHLRRFLLVHALLRHDFVYGRALAQTAGTAVMRLADAELLPYDFDDFTDTIRRYIDEVEKLAQRQARPDRRAQPPDRRRVFAATDDPREDRALRRRKTVPPFLNFAPLENGLAALERTAAALRPGAGAGRGERRRRAGPRGLARGQCAPDRVERALTLNDGLPNRPWFKNQIYAPGFYTGYGVKTLPAGAGEHRAEAVEAGRRTAADRARRQGAGKHRRGASKARRRSYNRANRPSSRLEENRNRRFLLSGNAGAEQKYR
jgi:N-acetylated-alpha-linked acidic dipeptidase